MPGSTSNFSVDEQ
jgi:hypothetical protein